MLPVYFVYLSTSLIKKKDSATTSLTKIVSLYQRSVIPTNVKANTALVEQSHSYNVHPIFMLALSNTVNVTKKGKLNNVVKGEDMWVIQPVRQNGVMEEVRRATGSPA